MSHQSDLIATDIEAYLAEHERKDLLRFLTCGSVDDGKSTLIGRLLHDSKMIYEDTLASLEADSTTQGSAGGHVDLALLTDGLKAEREQGITIDVAYRYFSTARRKFIIADTPGHEQYTRNMVTGASTCQLAIILVDARHGVVTQTKRHSFIANLLGIRHVAVAINKMDLVDWSQERFEDIRTDYLAFAKRLDLADPVFLPMSALLGDNVVEQSENLAWFDGPTMMEHLETVDVESGTDVDSFRLPVQLVTRPDLDFRGFAGTIASGIVRPGDRVVALPSGVSSNVARIVTMDGDLDVAGPGRAITLTLQDEIDVSRGDLLSTPGAEPLRAHDIDAMLVWMTDEPLRPGRQYALQSATGVSNATVTTIHHRVDVNTLHEHAAGQLELNDIAAVQIRSDRELLFDRYADNRVTGAFILVDRLSNATVAAGMISGAGSSWDRAPEDGLQAQASAISSAERAVRFGQQPCTVLLTGLTAAGKSTIATALERELFDRGKVAVRLDGENVRMGISRDLGFTASDRSENLRRAAEMARLLNNQGVIAVAAFVAPDAEVRSRVRDRVGDDRYLEVFVDTPIDVCRRRDTSGLYERADAGDVVDFPGVDYTYEPDATYDLRIDASVSTVDESVTSIIAALVQRGMLRG